LDCPASTPLSDGFVGLHEPTRNSPLEDNKVVRQKRAREFERTVSWILTLQGYPNCWLGEEASTYYGIGGIGELSCDIIAYAVNQIILIDCTVANPNEGKAEKLYLGSIALKKQLSEAIGYEGKVIPCIVTSMKCTEKRMNDVFIIDGNDLKSALEEVARGNKQALRIRDSTDEYDWF